MISIARLSPIESHEEFHWQRYVVEGMLAILLSLLVTLMLAAFRLYPAIPNISIIYLLVVIPLASTRGRYSAIMASVAAFLAFDFFLVPPLYTFTINRIEEWLALFVFLVTALVTSQLASALRLRAEEAKRRERETRTLYELGRALSNEETLERQLEVIAQALVTVFSSWGVRECSFLLPDSQGKLSVQAHAPQPLSHPTLSADESASARWAMTHERSVTLPTATFIPRTPPGIVPHVMVRRITSDHPSRRSVRFIPLKVSHRVVGVLRLRLQDDPSWFADAEYLEEETERPNTRTAFFWTFLDQATSAIEHARLRRENMLVEVLQRTDALRASLLSSVSHDLRTPLSSIKASASSLLQEDVQWCEEERRSFALTIEQEADRLNRLVSNLLDMSRIEGGAIKPEKEWYPLDELINDVLDRLRPLLRERPVHTHIPEDVPPIELDYLQMDQVLTNLIENAVRYTPPGSPIEIDVQRADKHVMISVADRGPGIPKADLERVFDKFYRVLTNRRSNGSATGTGLGLAVCRGLVEAHGGKIWAEQRPEGGTIFYIQLPIGAREGLFV